MSATEGRVIRAGFVPLLDSAMLVVAREMGFAAAEGLDLRLTREASWANIRDKISFGHLNVAHMLAPLPIAINLGLGPVQADIIAPMELGLGGNSIAVSLALASELSKTGPIDPNDPAAAAANLARVVAARNRTGHPRLVFGVVHQFSSHFYEMAYWLAVAGLAPYRDIELLVLPPSHMADALAGGQIDGFCAGEPWGTLAVGRGVGFVVTRKAKIWRAAPEKVLGVRRDWAEREPQSLAALMRALYRAATWCDEPQNRPQLAAILAQPHYVGLPKEMLEPVLENRSATLPPGAADSGFTFSAGAATFPWISHALWFYSQMVRWGQSPYSEGAMAVARRTYRPDIYRATLSPLGISMPSANAKLEGALLNRIPVGTPTGQLTLGPDGFFDGGIFDPDKVLEYVSRFSVHTRTAEIIG
ncbi:MAG: CmpA/NrtA family ABC transporter substrate-binding protein [Hyphomicrobiaceae bacterium]